MARYCGKCGTELNEKGLCPNCDKEIINKKQKSRKMKVLVVILFIVLLISCILGVFVVHNKNNRVNDENNSGISLLNSSINDTENKVSSITDTPTLPASSEKYDEILAEGDGYNIVRKHVETYDSAYDEYGVILDNGEWKTPMSNSNYLTYASEDILSDGYNSAYATPEYNYLGEGMFCVSVYCNVLGITTDTSEVSKNYMHGACIVLNIEEEMSFGAGGYLITKYYDGYTFAKMGNVGRVCRYDKKGNETVFADGSDSLRIGNPSQSLVYIGQKFYDVNTGEVKIDLSEYDMHHYGNSVDGKNYDSLSFNENGQCYFEFFNPAGTPYCGTIDLNGNFIEEPKPKNQ